MQSVVEIKVVLFNYGVARVMTSVLVITAGVSIRSVDVGFIATVSQSRVSR